MIDDLLTKGTNSLKKVYSLPRLIGVVLAIFLILTLSFVIWEKSRAKQNFLLYQLLLPYNSQLVRKKVFFRRE